MPTGNPNYFTVDRFGGITANFAGVIVAAPGSTVPATAVTGQLTDAQLAALSAAKLLGQVTDAQIAAIAAAKVTGLLTDSQIAALSTSKLLGQITTTQITPGAITTGLLAANAVVANIIAANSIDGSKINVPAVEAVGGVPNPLTAQNKINFTRASDGATVAFMAGWNNVGVQVGSVMRASGLSKQTIDIFSDNTGSAVSRLRTTLDNTVSPPAGKVEAEAQDGAGGLDWLTLIIDSKGRAGYVQTATLGSTLGGGGSFTSPQLLATPANNTHSAMGFFSGVWPGAVFSVYTDWISIPTAWGFLTGQYFAVIATANVPDSTNSFVINAVVDPTNKRFKFIVQSPFSAIPPAGQTFGIAYLIYGGA